MKDLTLCPNCGSNDTEANTWETWCNDCSARLERAQDPEQFDKIRAAHLERRDNVNWDAVAAVVREQEASHITGAQFRARIAFLGLTIDALSKLIDYDKRALTRMATGKTPVTGTVLTALLDLEAQARELVREWAGEDEIEIPRLNIPQDPGQYPPHWYLAIAARVLDKEPGIRVTWEE